MEKASKNSNTSADSRQSNLNVKAELKAAFDTSTTASEMFEALDKMKDSCLFDVKALSLYCWKLAVKLAQTEQHENILGFEQRKMKGKAAQVKKAFSCAKSSDGMLKAFQEMELHFDEKDLGYDCWILAQKLYAERQDPENILCYGKRALQFLLDQSNICGVHSSSLMIPSTLTLLGYACCKLNRYDESFGYLNWSERNLNMLEAMKCYPTELVLRSLLATHYELAIVKTAKGKGEEVVIHMRKILEIQERTKAACSVNQAIEKVVDGLEGLRLSEQDRVDGAVRLLRKMKKRAGGGVSAKKNSKGRV